MPVTSDFRLDLSSDGVVTLQLAPPNAIGGWSLQFILSKAFGGTAQVTKSMASGYYNVSGMNIVNSGQGILSITFHPAEVSGLDQGNYAYQISRLDSGYQSDLADGFRIAY